MRELNFIKSGLLQWRDKPDPAVIDPTDALVRPFVASRCDGDTLPIHRPVARVLQLGLRVGLIDPAVGSIAGAVPFRGPFAIGHECVAEVTQVGPEVTQLHVGDIVIVPWAVSCGTCPECMRGLTAKCSTTATTSPGKTLAAFGFGSSSGPWGGMVADSLRIPYADHMLVKVPNGVDPLRVAAASDNLADAWRAIAPPLRERPGGRVLVIGGGAQSIGLYAAGLAIAYGASVVDYYDDRQSRLDVAAAYGAVVHKLDGTKRKSLDSAVRDRYDVAVEASAQGAGLAAALRALRPGGICTATGYYFASGIKVPIMDMYATSATLKVGVSHVRPHLPELLDFIVRSNFSAELVTSVLADWEDAPEAYATHTTKLVLHRQPLGLADRPRQASNGRSIA
ncbi:alcohol dehydrogenase catalytic domain-containing protein [Streptomyces sp. SID13031]|uniref:zinc-dependent alcohol dehydrogenase n=1 Tax=Streptomyces sp. SID13031 TaxID=2706046 RepID=UPI0013C5ABA4|nr:alcohol dehydrogenase catalytic domain-containing protein [Streptomyces sp. SID13031]NEA37554.1 alcohol dehydrogenase catalytic domain-containing protein [Streptomyces sp. SID13031]